MGDWGIINIVMGKKLKHSKADVRLNRIPANINQNMFTFMKKKCKIIVFLVSYYVFQTDIFREWSHVHYKFEKSVVLYTLKYQERKRVENSKY